MLIAEIVPAARMSLGVAGRGDTLVNEPGEAVLGQSWREAGADQQDTALFHEDLGVRSAHPSRVACAFLLQASVYPP